MRNSGNNRPQPVFRGFGPALGAFALLASALAGAPIATSAHTTGTGAATVSPQAEIVPAARHTRPISVTVRMADFRFDMPKRHFTPGHYRLTVINAGRAPHALTINGPGVRHQGTRVVAPGHSATLTVTLHHGRYDLYCPVGTHAQHGMRTAITVS